MAAADAEQAVPAKGETKQDCCMKTELVREDGRTDRHTHRYTWKDLLEKEETKYSYGC